MSLPNLIVNINYNALLENHEIENNIKSYYEKNDNFHDEIPYDLYNMVEMYKQISKKQILPSFLEFKNNDKKIMNELGKLYVYKLIVTGTYC